jgi:hypothetical protein
MSVSVNGNQRDIIVHILEEVVEELLPPFLIVIVLILLPQQLIEQRAERKAQILQLRTQQGPYL